jgi:alkylhydroperoxidase family enzyme
VNLEGGEYEWVQHVPIVLALGGTQAQIDALKAGDDQAACFSEAEKAALRFTREVVVDVGASEASLAEARKHLSEREIVELILVAGFYIMLARLTETLDIPNDPPIGDKLVSQIEARVASKKK